MSKSSHSTDVSTATIGPRVLVLAVPADSRWTDVSLAGAHPQIVHSNQELYDEVPHGDGPGAVVLTSAWLAATSTDAVDLVDSIKGLASLAVVIEGDFDLGERLPGNADACIPRGATVEQTSIALDAAFRQLKLRRATSTDRAFVESLLSSVQTLVLAIDSGTRIREFNQGCEISTGYSLGDVFGRPLSEILVDGDDKGLTDTLRANRGDLYPTNLVLEFRTTSDESRLVECTFSPFFDSAGQVELAVVTGIDITEQRRFEAALTESERAFRSVVESSPDSVVVGSVADGGWLYANPAALELFGVESLEELQDYEVSSLLGTDVFEALLERLARVDQSHKPQPTEMELFLPSGETVSIESVEIPLKYREQSAFLAFSRDLSERKELMARMMQLDRMVAVGTLAAGVGHEINNPLAYVTSNIEFATDQLRNRSDKTEAVDDVVLALEEAAEGAVRVRDIVRDLKELSRNDQDRIEPIDLESVLESALNIAWHEVRTRADVRRDFQPVPLVHGAGGRIRQLFVNVLANAAQAMEGCDPASSFITLKIESVDSGEYVAVTISDQGDGIAEENVRRVFDPFYTTKPVGAGTGLGLTIAQRIIESVGGSIAIRSDEGEGTTVEMVFEAVTSEVSEVSELQPSHQVPIRLLLIDDEPMIAKSVRRALTDASEVISFETGRDALNYLEHDRDFDAILCDLVMPQVSGPEFHRELLERWAELEGRVVFMTGGAYTDSTSAFASEHGARILEKPFAAWDLREALYRAARG